MPLPPPPTGANLPPRPLRGPQTHTPRQHAAEPRRQHASGAETPFTTLVADLIPTNLRKPLLPNLGVATPPTVYIISHSRSALGRRDPCARAYARGRYDQACQSVPKNALYLYEIDCENFVPPPDSVCAKHTGRTEVVKRYVLADGKARVAVHIALQEVFKALQMGHVNIWLETKCLFGTHRSVAVAEIVAEGLAMKGVRAVTQHPHKRMSG